MPPTVDHCPCLSQLTVPPLPHLSSSSISSTLETLFICEECDRMRLRDTLSVVPSDPPDLGDGRTSVPITGSTVGEPPFFLYCNHCRWDSAEVGITFEKSTRLAEIRRPIEDSAPDSLEFERLKEHFKPVIRASSLSSFTANAPAAPSSAAHSHHVRTNSITAAASAALARDIPGVSKYNPLARSGRGGSNKDKSTNKDEMPEYRSRVDIASASARGTGGGEADVDYIRHLENVGEVANLEQSSWATSTQTADLKSLRIPLHSKRSKRCPTCTRILIKPAKDAVGAVQDQARRTLSKSTATAADDDRAAAGIHAGKTHPLQLALTNPLYDPIQVRLTVHRVHPPDEDDEDDDMFGLDDEFGIAGRLPGREKDARASRPAKVVGVLEKKANMTLVGGEVVIGKEARGHVKAAAGKPPETKTFPF
ncbi:dynactin p62 family-domain-containing protein [Mycena polygramma]|nr:dynactin p62 family-domain-containing protein [Mycena polygramma]